MGTRRPYILWNARMDGIIRQGWEEHIPTRDLAARLHISEFSVRERAKKLGLPMRGHGIRSKLEGVTSLQSAWTEHQRDRAATIEFELLFCDWADRTPGVEICGYEAAA